MKNQYIADISDYGKYGLLRYLAGHGISIGVNWYLTENDGSNDGRFIDYLENEKERFRDEALFDFLASVVKLKDKSVSLIEDHLIIPNAVYYSQIVSNTKREEWHYHALEMLADAELVFCDPDNGPIGKKSIHSKDADKYVAPTEIADYYRRGQNVVYYCQKACRSISSWIDTKNEMRTHLPDAMLLTLTYHRGTQRSYIFVIHPKDYLRYVNLLRSFERGRWGRGRMFALEVQGVDQDHREDTAGNYLKIELMNGATVELRMRNDGYVEIKDSRKPNQAKLLQAEHFVDKL